MNNNSFFSKKTRVVLILSMVAAVALAVIFSVSGSKSTNLFQNLLAPARSLTAAAARGVEKVYNYAFHYESLEAENSVLREKISSMEEEIREVDVLQRENERLSVLLQLEEEHTDYRILPAYIIAWDSGNWNSTFKIGKGSNSGVQEGMIVITEYSEVVGIITDVGDTWSTVTTIMDSTLEISASVSSSGETGVVKGSYRTDEEEDLRLNYLPIDAQVKNGDQVVTTGSSYYPKDLVIGYVTDAGLDDTGVSKYALLESSVVFTSLEQVFIITDYTTTYYSDTAAAAASAETASADSSTAQ